MRKQIRCRNRFIHSCFQDDESTISSSTLRTSSFIQQHAPLSHLQPCSVNRYEAPSTSPWPPVQQTQTTPSAGRTTMLSHPGCTFFPFFSSLHPAESQHSSAIALGYIPPSTDPYTHLFTRPGRMPPLQQIKRAPLINLGTHHRSWSVDRLVERWLEGGGPRQVVGLGAGSDARFWRVS
jgi:hypothetical protein